MAESYPADEAYPAPARPGPAGRGRRWLIALLILLLVLVGLFVVADRIAVGVAQRAVAERVDRELANKEIQSAPADVGVRGFPFLTQVVGGRYDEISILLHDVAGPIQGHWVRIPRVNVEAREVRAPLEALRSGSGEVIAGTVEATAIITYDSVAELIGEPGVQLSEADGKLHVAAPLTVFGQRFVLRGTANLTVDDGEVLIAFADLTADGLPQNAAAQALVSAFAERISVRFNLPAFPFELKVRQVRPQPDGLAVTAGAENVPLNALG